MNEPKGSVALQEHMLWTYYGLRVGLAAIGIALPLLVLLIGAFLHEKWLEPSISEYYHTPPKHLWFTTRDIFVGGLLAAAACLYLYKGFSNKENLALNLGGVFAVFVALLPTASPDEPGGLVSRLHGTSAVLFFLCIAYVSLFRARDTLHLLPPDRRRVYQRQYMWAALAMIASPAAAVVISFGLTPLSEKSTVTFWVEALGVWSFAGYWIIKTREMRESSAERRALDAELQREVVPANAKASVKEVGVATPRSRGVEEGIVPAR